mgnify:FL=1
MAIIKGTFGRRLADTLTGTAGTDEFWIDNTGDTIINGGRGDRIVSSINYTLTEGGPSVLTLYGAAQVGIGNSDANIIAGNAKNNFINGGGGMDELWGGAGADTFVFDRLGDFNADFIGDFNRAEGDRIALSGAAFGLAAGTQLGYSVGVAVGSGPQVIRQDAGLFFDPDGTGAGKAVVFAAINASAWTTLDASAFAVI